MEPPSFNILTRPADISSNRTFGDRELETSQRVDSLCHF